MTLRGVLWTEAQILAEAEIRMDDVANVRWTEAQFKLAINATVRRARGKWWEARIDGSQTYDQEDFRYDLPPICEGVEAVYFEAISEDRPRYFVVPGRWHVEGVELVFDKRVPKYDGQTMYIHYIVYQTNLMLMTAADGAIAGTAFTSATGTFLTAGTIVQEGDTVIVVGDDTYYVKTVTNGTTLVLDRSGTTGDTLTYHIARDTDLPYEYLIYGTMAELYEMASRNRPGVEVEENIKWSTYYRQLAELELTRQARHMKPQRRY